MEILKLYDLKLLRKIKRLRGNSNADYDKRFALAEGFVKEVLPKLNKNKLPKADLKGHHLDFFVYWNKFVGNKKLSEGELEYIVHELSSNLLSAAIFLDPKMTAKEIATSSFRIRGNNCRKSGKHISCKLTDKLELEFTQYTSKKEVHNGREYQGASFSPLEKNSFTDKINEVIIDCPSGRLLINDWFRCDKNEFTNAVKEENPDYSEENSISYPRGRVTSILRYAKLGFMSVNMTDAPSVYLEGNKIVFGEDKTFDFDEMSSEKKNNKNFKGSICLDLWAASCIDEQVFMDILIAKTKGMTQAQAKSHLAKVKKFWTNISVKVKPGKYKLSFCGDFETFDAKMRRKGCKVNKKYKMYCLLEKV